jgi:hypothetical protein
LKKTRLDYNFTVYEGDDDDHHFTEEAHRMNLVLEPSASFTICCSMHIAAVEIRFGRIMRKIPDIGAMCYGLHFFIVVYHNVVCPQASQTTNTI